VLAYGALRAFSEAGLQVGRDLGVVGHDDFWPSAVVWPPLTTIRQPVQRIGSIAADILIDNIEGTATPAGKVLFQPDLEVRESTAALVFPREK
jgi:LacI family transcriptional regulator